MLKKFFQVALGIVTSVGGFLEIGSIATAAQAGAAFRFELGWAVALGTICLIFLVEMSGRLAAVSKRTIAGAMRERFGFTFFVVPLIGIGIVTFLTLASEIGGMALALQYATGVRFQLWALPVAFVAWLLLWKATFGVIEKGVSLLGLVTLCFLVAAVKQHPSVTLIAHGLIPSIPASDATHYWFIAVSILGASITPYLFLFYSSGAIEDKWSVKDLPVNRFVAASGMTFGGGLSLAVLIVAGAVLFPRGISLDRAEQLPLVLSLSLGRWGVALFAASLGIACLGATLEIGLALAYQLAQGFGWRWSQDLKGSEASRFTMVYTVAILLAALLILTGIDPLKLTVLTMAFTAASLPLVIVPFLFLMNDKRYLKEHTNGWFSNAVVIFSIVLAFVLAVVSIPLELAGS